MENNVNEIWKQIPNISCDNYIYEVSNMGRVRRILIVQLQKTKSGYPCVRISTNKKNKTYAIHILVAEMFLEKKEFEVVNHKNSNILDNRVENLEWVSIRENVCHSIVGEEKKNKYTGVFYYKRTKKYNVQVSYKGVRYSYGSWSSAELGSIMYMSVMCLIGDYNRYAKGVYDFNNNDVNFKNINKIVNEVAKKYILTKEEKNKILKYLNLFKERYNVKK